MTRLTIVVDFDANPSPQRVAELRLEMSRFTQAMEEYSGKVLSAQLELPPAEALVCGDVVRTGTGSTVCNRPKGHEGPHDHIELRLK